MLPEGYMLIHYSPHDTQVHTHSWTLGTHWSGTCSSPCATNIPAIQVPESPLSHMPFGMLILYGRSDVPISSFQAIADPPLSVEQRNPVNRMLE